MDSPVDGCVTSSIHAWQLTENKTSWAPGLSHIVILPVMVGAKFQYIKFGVASEEKHT
jgi:hypothetical protein